MLKNLDFQSTDTRTRRFLAPKRILKTFGEVENASYLLRYRNRQIRLQEKELARIVTKDGVCAGILFDFGTEFHGGACIAARKVEGEGLLRLSFGESAAEALSHLGEKGACNDHSPRDFVVQVQNYSTCEHAATGYRFLYIELLSEGSITLAAVQGVAVYHDYEYLGSFACDDEELNQIYDTAAYTCHLCIQNELWDGIKRDRLVWIGDVNPELKTIKYVFGEIPELYSALALAADAAEPPLWIDKHPTYSLWWLVNLEEWAFHTGNYGYVDAQRDYVRAVTAQIIDAVDEEGYFTAGYFLDWPSKAYPELSANGIRAVLLLAMRAAEALCQYLGDGELAAKCREIAARVRQKRCTGGHLKQAAALLLLEDLHDASCVELLQKDGAKGFSTFMSYYILSAMARVCSTEDTLAALKGYYGAMLKLGATTFFEDFDIEWAKNACRIDEIPGEGQSDVHGDNGAYCYKGFRHSFCHGWASGPVAFLTEHVLGVRVTASGCREIELTPHLGALRYAKGSIATPYGKVEIAHEKTEDGKVKTTVKAPAEVKVTVK